MLRPGGLLLLVEFDPLPTADGRRTSAGAGATAAAATGGAAKRAFASGAPGWDALWDAYVRALRAQGADPAVPARLSALVWATRAYDMSRTFAQQADVPVGFSHKGAPRPDLVRMYAGADVARRPHAAHGGSTGVDGRGWADQLAEAVLAFAPPPGVERGQPHRGRTGRSVSAGGAAQQSPTCRSRYQEMILSQYLLHRVAQFRAQSRAARNGPLRDLRAEARRRASQRLCVAR
jgi:hypothetical protein